MIYGDVGLLSMSSVFTQPVLGSLVQGSSGGQTFRGLQCELASEECGNGLYCLNGGKCPSPVTSSAKCGCNPGYVGIHCQVSEQALDESGRACTRRVSRLSPHPIVTQPLARFLPTGCICGSQVH